MKLIAEPDGIHIIIRTIIPGYEKIWYDNILFVSNKRRIV